MRPISKEKCCLLVNVQSLGNVQEGLGEGAGGARGQMTHCLENSLFQARQLPEGGQGWGTLRA